MTYPLPYQLTRHPVGSKSEIWAISWPLMLGFCSNSLMLFCDRLFLAHYSLEAMNAHAGAVGGWCMLALNAILLFLLFRARSQKLLLKEAAA